MYKILHVFVLLKLKCQDKIFNFLKFTYIIYGYYWNSIFQETAFYKNPPSPRSFIEHNSIVSSQLALQLGPDSWPVP